MVLDNKKAAFRPYSAHCSFPIKPSNAFGCVCYERKEVPCKVLKM